MNENSFQHAIKLVLEPDKLLERLVDVNNFFHSSPEIALEFKEIDSHLALASKHMPQPDLGKKGMVLQLNEDAQYLIGNVDLIALRNDTSSGSGGGGEGGTDGGGGELDLGDLMDASAPPAAPGGAAAGAPEWTQFKAKFNQFVTAIAPIVNAIYGHESAETQSNDVELQYVRLQGLDNQGGGGQYSDTITPSVSYVVPSHRVLVHFWRNNSSARLYFRLWQKVWRTVAEHRLTALAFPLTTLMHASGGLVSVTWIPPVGDSVCYPLSKKAIHGVQEQQLQLLLSRSSSNTDDTSGSNSGNSSGYILAYPAYDGRCYILASSPYLSILMANSAFDHRQELHGNLLTELVANATAGSDDPSVDPDMVLELDEADENDNDKPQKSSGENRILVSPASAQKYLEDVAIPNWITAVIDYYKQDPKLKELLLNDSRENVAIALVAPGHQSFLRLQFRVFGIRQRYLAIAYRIVGARKSELSSKVGQEDVEALLGALLLVLEGYMACRTLKCMSHAQYYIQCSKSKHPKQQLLVEIINAMMKLMLVQKDGVFWGVNLLPCVRKKFNDPKIQIDPRTFPTALVIRVIAGLMVLQYEPKAARFIRIVPPAMPSDFGLREMLLPSVKWYREPNWDDSPLQSLGVPISAPLVSYRIASIVTDNSLALEERLAAIAPIISELEDVDTAEASLEGNFYMCQINRAIWESFVALFLLVQAQQKKGQYSGDVPDKAIVDAIKSTRKDQQDGYVEHLRFLIDRDNQDFVDSGAEKLNGNQALNLHYFAHAFMSIWQTAAPSVDLSVLQDGTNCLRKLPFGHFMLAKASQISFARAPKVFDSTFASASSSDVAKLGAIVGYSEILRTQWSILTRYTNVAVTSMLAKQTQTFMQTLASNKLNKYTKYVAVIFFEGLAMTRGLVHDETVQSLLVVLNFLDSAGKKEFTATVVKTKPESKERMELLVKHMLTGREKAIDAEKNKEEAAKSLEKEPTATAAALMDMRRCFEDVPSTPLEYYTFVLQAMRRSDVSAAIMVEAVLGNIEKEKKAKREQLIQFANERETMQEDEGKARNMIRVEEDKGFKESLVDQELAERQALLTELEERRRKAQGEKARLDAEHAQEREAMTIDESKIREEINTEEAELFPPFLTAAATEKEEAQRRYLDRMEREKADREQREAERAKAESDRKERAALEEQESQDRKGTLLTPEIQDFADITHLAKIERNIIVLEEKDEFQKRLGIDHLEESERSAIVKALTDALEGTSKQQIQEFEDEEGIGRDMISQDYDGELNSALVIPFLQGREILTFIEENRDERDELCRIECDEFQEASNECKLDKNRVKKLLQDQYDAEEREVFCELETVQRDQISSSDEGRAWRVVVLTFYWAHKVAVFQAVTELAERSNIRHVEASEREAIEDIFLQEKDFTLYTELKKIQLEERNEFQDQMFKVRLEIEQFEAAGMEYIIQLSKSLVYLELSEVAGREVMIQEENDEINDIWKYYAEASTIAWEEENERRRIAAELARREECYQHVKSEALNRSRRDTACEKVENHTTLPTTGIRIGLQDKVDIIRWLKTAQDSRPQQPIEVTASEFKLKQPVTVLQRWLDSAPLWEKATSKELPSWGIGKKRRDIIQSQQLDIQSAVFASSSAFRKIELGGSSPRRQLMELTRMHASLLSSHQSLLSTATTSCLDLSPSVGNASLSRSYSDGQLLLNSTSTTKLSPNRLSRLSSKVTALSPLQQEDMMYRLKKQDPQPEWLSNLKMEELQTGNIGDGNSPNSSENSPLRSARQHYMNQHQYRSSSSPPPLDDISSSPPDGQEKSQASVSPFSTQRRQSAPATTTNNSITAVSSIQKLPALKTRQHQHQQPKQTINSIASAGSSPSLSVSPSHGRRAQTTMPTANEVVPQGALSPSSKPPDRKHRSVVHPIEAPSSAHMTTNNLSNETGSQQRKTRNNATASIPVVAQNPPVQQQQPLTSQSQPQIQLQPQHPIENFIWVQVVRDLEKYQRVWYPFKILHSYDLHGGEGGGGGGGIAGGQQVFIRDVDDLVHAAKAEIESNMSSGSSGSRSMKVNALCMQVAQQMNGVPSSSMMMTTTTTASSANSNVMMLERDDIVLPNTKATVYFVSLGVDI